MTAPARSLLAVALLTLALGAPTAPARAQDAAGDADVVEDTSAIIDPQATIAGTPTPTPTPTATAVRTQTPGETATATPTSTPAPTQRNFISPGYGNAAQQAPALKHRERRAACRAAHRPPTSHMLGTVGVVLGRASASWIPLVMAVALGAAIFAVAAFALRRRGGAAEPPGALEGIATLVAICGGLAGLAGQFLPAARITPKPAREASLVMRDVKPRITRGEYARKVGADVRRAKAVDLSEVGDVIWLQIALQGFKGEPLRVQYGLYDGDGSETLLPGTDKQVRLRPPGSEVETIFLPLWVGFPRSARFTAEFRLVDRRGRVQQLATTGRMRGSRFRYACGSSA